MKLIVVAMYEEIEGFLNSESFVIVEHQFLKIYKNDKTYLLITGIGLVNAALTLSAFLAIYQNEVTQIYNFGSAGSSSKNLQVFDIVVANRVYYSTVDLTGFGYAYGQIPKESEYFEMTLAQSILMKLSPNFDVHSSNLASSDIFISDENKFENFVIKASKSIEVFDMEAAALCHVAKKFAKPINVIKLISDNLLIKNNEVQFSEFIGEISLKMKEIINVVLK
ncbi:5'-methylthioadenosine/S-adenosylhomocysteine nucleosidase [Spiroplasma sabaudiense Ar-1343]|uniref:adenosylhomocysteine nucleosidase n=1 Tax=Spiroplasma sabaudiense Ar-1343 TaxID=1276257 RepID=W6AAS5_9MOLU|nr:5'-methylthioadenosine/S-adenosylhomocysteine nucleosidase [Spiroplasma sabaudiense]AHI53955.1 5'-methylthioadenosine/S-adenosylhomocysteine nucleosidase [Spiroplasma sabaudiense Ar-1343]